MKAKQFIHPESASRAIPEVDPDRPETYGSVGCHPEGIGHSGLAYAWEFLRRNADFQRQSDAALKRPQGREAIHWGLSDWMPWQEPASSHRNLRLGSWHLGLPSISGPRARPFQVRARELSLHMGTLASEEAADSAMVPVIAELPDWMKSVHERPEDGISIHLRQADLDLGIDHIEQQLLWLFTLLAVRDRGARDSQVAKHTQRSGWRKLLWLSDLEQKHRHLTNREIVDGWMHSDWEKIEPMNGEKLTSNLAESDVCKKKRAARHLIYERGYLCCRKLSDEALLKYLREYTGSVKKSY